MPRLATTALKVDLVSRDKLARELLELRRRYAPFEARDSEICAILKRDAADHAENFQIVVDKVGRIKVSAPKDKVCKGTAPEIIVEAFLALPERERDKLIEKGIVRLAEQWTGAYYGSVAIDLF